MDSLYTPEIHTYLHSRNWPKGLSYTVAEKVEPEPHLNIIFTTDNWLTLTFQQQLQATEVVREVMAKLWADGVPVYVGRERHDTSMAN